MTRKRAISSITGETNQPSSLRTHQKANKVPCHCSKCKGKLVLKRTKLLHESGNTNESESHSSSSSSNIPELEIIEAELPQKDTDDDSISTSANMRREITHSDVYSMSSIQRVIGAEIPQIGTEEELSDVDVDTHINPEYFIASRMRVRRYIDRAQTTIEEGSESEEDETSDSGDENEPPISAEIFEDYSTPNFDPYNIEEVTVNENFLWILLWIMKFRTKFNIPETATESLIKFMKLVLNEIGGDDFKDFPDSLFSAKQTLGLKERFQSFVPCTKCHKLYLKKEVEHFCQGETPTIMKCRHIEYPNSVSRRSRRCNEPLSRQVGNDFQPKLIYPFVGIRQQLFTMFCRPGFENSLRHWANRTSFGNILTDIYDGQIWKSLKEGNDTSANFFRREVADSHIGLMLNLDWFQPYEGTVHSTGVIYAAICNLPRDIRFKRENLLILGILPGPHEVSLHKINHYLAPIVDELLSLWAGISLNRTFEYQNGRNIRAALILVSCDIPAARKICGHVSALVSCHRCEKKANYENGQHNFAGIIDDMNEGLVNRNSSQHREDALGWRRCNSKAARDRFVRQTGVRWSELLRLPYFDPIRFTIVDPMHCLFLGIAKWIVKRIWIDEGILTSNVLKEVQKKMNQFQVPADLGRIPKKVDCGEGFSYFTADQWRNFFTIYATVTLWDYLPEKDRKILSQFVRICSIFVSRIVEVDSIREANQRLIEIVKLIEENYGHNKITPNLHLSLHLHECSYDYGPLHTFWCFSFERMNGIIGSLPNSHRKIEPELMRRLMNDNRIESIINSDVQTKGLHLLENRPSVGSLSASDQLASDEMEKFWLNSRNIQNSLITGCETFPGEMLNPSSENVLLPEKIIDLMVNFYTDTYVTYEFRKPADELIQSSITIRIIMNQFGRCRIGSEVFGSLMSNRHIKSSYVLANFVTDNGDIDCYPGQVQYYFKHIVDLPTGPSEHNLAFIRWYKPADTANLRYYFTIDEICNVELWKPDFYPESRDCIIPVHNILGRFVPTKYQISTRSNAVEYIAINPINRKLHIR